MCLFNSYLLWKDSDMQISKFSDYALRILIHLATSEEDLMSTREIADL